MQFMIGIKGEAFLRSFWPCKSQQER